MGSFTRGFINGCKSFIRGFIKGFTLEPGTNRRRILLSLIFNMLILYGIYYVYYQHTNWPLMKGFGLFVLLFGLGVILLSPISYLIEGKEPFLMWRMFGFMKKK